MSLIAHYKLDENLLDSSGYGNDLSYLNDNGKLVSDTDGKIGSCYKRAGLNDGTDYFQSKNKINLQGDFTMCCWAKVTACQASANGLVTNHSHASNSGSGIAIKYISATDFRISCNTGTGTARTYQSYYGTTNIKDAWHHLVLRFKKLTNEFSLWVDGSVEKIWTYAQYNIEDYLELFAWSTSYVTSSNYRPAGYIDDVRIYDHALSTKEIHELSKAKILHYTFDDFQEPTTNLVPYTSLATFTTSKTSPKGTVSGWQITGTGNDTRKFILGGYSGSILAISANTTYTMSFLYWHSEDIIDDVYLAMNGTGYPEGNVYLRLNYATHVELLSGSWISEDLGDGWKYVQATFTTTADTTAINGIFFDSDVSGYTCFLANVQIEKKDHATEYVSTSRTGTITDIDGKNSITLAESTTPQWTDDSKVGAGAYKFTNYPQSLISPVNVTQLTKFTYSCFVYRTSESSAYLIMGARFGNNVYESMAIISNKLCLHKYVFNDNSDISVAETSNDLLGLNEWHHLAITYDNGTTKSYIDGVLAGSGYHVNTAYTARPLQINYESNVSNTYRYFLGKIDDVRVYEKALNEDEISNIAKKRFSLDENGNMYCDGIVEDTATSFDDKGQLHSPLFNANIVDNGLISWLPLNNNTADKIRYRYGSVSGAVIVEGTNNQNGYSFDGVDDKISLVEDVWGDNFKNPFTISFWTKGELNSSQFAYILHKGASGSIGDSVVSISTTNTGVFTFSLNGNWSGGATDVIQDSDTWYHLVMTWDGATMKGYINNVLKKTLSISSITQTTTGTVLCLGNGNIPYAPRYYGGIIQDLRIYNRAISAEEVSNLYELPKYKNIAMRLTEDSLYIQGERYYN